MEFAPRPLKTYKKQKSNTKSQSVVNFSNSRISCESISSRVCQVELAKYCPKKLFYIVFVAESDNDSALLLDKFVEVSRNYEIVSSVTFITREDVLNLLETTNDHIFPSQLKPLLLEVIESVKGFDLDDIPPIYESQLIKLKMIQVMYEQYVAQVKKNRKEKHLEDLLNFLSRECRKAKKKDETGRDPGSSDRNNSPMREDERKKGKKDDKDQEDSKDSEIDYTSIPLDNDGVSFEENLFDYVWFYCIKGVYSSDILYYITDHLSCPICAVVKIADSEADSLGVSFDIVSFWKNVDLIFFGNTTPYKHLEDTMLMEFTPTQKCTQENVLDLFQQFVSVLRRIPDVKISHLTYLRSLSLNTPQNNNYAIVPLECLQTYNRSLKQFPLECINSTLILNALLKEVCYRLDNIKTTTRTASSRSLLSLKGPIKLFHSVQCMDPLRDFEAFTNVKKKSGVSNIKHGYSSFLTHDHDVLLKVLKCYKNIGPKIFDISLNFMKGSPVFRDILLNNDYHTHRDIPHTHDIDPSHKFEVKDEELLANFMYLFLFSSFSNKADAPNATEPYSFTENLITFDPFRYWTGVKPKCEAENKQTKVNLYNTSVVNFWWKEKLSREVMVQEIFDATNNFLYYDQKYSPETNNFLIVLSDKLDAFGLNTKIFDNFVRTPPCLRDFCRYTTVDDAAWLQEHGTKIMDEYTFNLELNEVCRGTQKMKSQMNMYQEYSYLLEGSIREESADIIENITDAEEINKPGVSFEKVFTDLQKYPTHHNLLKECGLAPEFNERLCFDLGTQACKITGHMTTFCSHDGVKVTIDNTRLLQEHEKCTVNVISDGNTLILHSSEALHSEPYVLSLLLKDGTRVSFVVKREESSLPGRLEKVQEENEEEIGNILFEPQKEQEDDKPVAELGVDHLKESANQDVHCVDEDFLKGVLGQILEQCPINEDRDELLEAILYARQNNGVIYKVNIESDYLKRLNNNLKVPIEHALRNVIPREILINSDPKLYETHTKRFESPNEDKSDLELVNSVDFRLCLPSGLFIRAHPGVVDKKIIMIKQEYVEDKPDFKTVQHEEFRLFSGQGFICIKKIDGTVTILKGNGDIIDFEKPTDGSDESSSFKSCYCSTLDDYRNKLNKLLKEENSSDFYTSRRGHITHKQNHVLDQKLLQLLKSFDVPYLKKSITRFDGKNIKIQGTKITQKQLYHMTSQQDFFTEEIFFERSDDFRSTFERNGSQTIIFPDGTLISNSVNIAEDLVDDFVYVKIGFQYEHPNYATVSYDFDKVMKIVLSNGVVVRKVVNEENFTVNMSENSLVSVSKEDVCFQKTCQDCAGSFQCNFNIKPFLNNNWSSSNQFLEVQDTYEKCFYSDFAGNCFRKPDYLKGRLNWLQCNHYKKFNNYKKLFVINTDLTGEMFSTNDEVQMKLTKMTSADPDSSVRSYKLLSNNRVNIYEFRHKKYVSYSDRFFNTSLYKYYYNNINQTELYSTYRVFHTMFQTVDEIDRHILNIRKAYFDDLGSDYVINNIASLTNDLKNYKEASEKELHAQQQGVLKKKKDQEEEEIRKRNAMCPCVKQRITMADKMLSWRKTCSEFKNKLRRKHFPGYFNSEFCKISK